MTTPMVIPRLTKKVVTIAGSIISLSLSIAYAIAQNNGNIKTEGINFLQKLRAIFKLSFLKIISAMIFFIFLLFAYFKCYFIILSVITTIYLQSSAQLHLFSSVLLLQTPSPQLEQVDNPPGGGGQTPVYPPGPPTGFKPEQQVNGIPCEPIVSPSLAQGTDCEISSSGNSKV